LFPPERDSHETKSAWFQEPSLTWNLKLGDLLKDIGRPYGFTAGEVAIAWTLGNPAVTGAVGIRAPEQLEGVTGAADVKLSDADLARTEAHFAERTRRGALAENPSRGPPCDRIASRRANLMLPLRTTS
jgi:aryl-alcohol dehydrogenase-like predicted oxidoreductase